MCRDHRQHFDSFQDINQIPDAKYHPRPLVIWATINNISFFHYKLVQVVDVTCYWACITFYLEVLPSFMSRMLWELLHLLRILGIVILLTITILSCVVSNRDTNRWTVLFGFRPSINPIALELMVNITSLGHWLSNHHSNIDHTT